MDKLERLYTGVFIILFITCVFVIYHYYNLRNDVQNGHPDTFKIICKSALSGALRGCLMGLIMNGVEGAVTSAVVLAVVNPIVTGIEHIA